MLKTVHVVAWQYRGGGGFDWYAKAEDADTAFEQEKVNALDLASSGWAAYRFDYDAHSILANEIEGEIDERLDELCLQARDWFPRGNEHHAPLVFMAGEARDAESE